MSRRQGWGLGETFVFFLFAFLFRGVGEWRDGLNNFVLVVLVIEIALHCIGYVGSFVGTHPPL
jgi:hypothetical protein